MVKLQEITTGVDASILSFNFPDLSGFFIRKVAYEGQINGSSNRDIFITLNNITTANYAIL